MKFALSVASSIAALSLTAAPALAQSWWWWLPTPTHPTPASVPEIDASTSLLAVAAVGAAMLFAWERNRRRA